MRGLLGEKIGMTRIFNDNGDVVPVTILSVGPCVVTQVKTLKKMVTKLFSLVMVRKRINT